VDKRLAAMTDWSSLPVLLTVPEAAEVLRVNVHTVYELVRTHGIPHTHLGRAIRIPRDALRQHIESPHPVSEASYIPPQLSLARPRVQVQSTAAGGRAAAAGASRKGVRR